MSNGTVQGSSQPLRYLRPLRPDGTVAENTAGCHRGNAERYNVSNPQPQFQYFWARKEAANLRRFIARGYEIVPPDSPEHAMVVNDPNLAQALKGAQQTGELILLRIREEKLRENRAALQAKRDSLTGSYTDDYLETTPAEERYARSAGAATRYAQRGHGTFQG